MYHDETTAERLERAGALLVVAARGTDSRRAAGLTSPQDMVEHIAETVAGLLLYAEAHGHDPELVAARALVLSGLPGAEMQPGPVQKPCTYCNTLFGHQAACVLSPTPGYATSQDPLQMHQPVHYLARLSHQRAAIRDSLAEMGEAINPQEEEAICADVHRVTGLHCDLARGHGGMHLHAGLESTGNFLSWM